MRGVQFYMYILLFALLLPLSNGVLSEQKKQQIDDFIEQVMECVGIPGLSLAAVQNGDIVITQGYGKANLEQGIDVDENTIFGIASSSKAIFGALVSRVLSQSEMYDLDTPVRNIMGETFHLYNGFYTNHTTFRDMLNMKTGLPGHDYIWLLDNYSKEEFLERIRFFEPVDPIRSAYGYNNLLFSLPAFALEQIRGVPWEQIMEEELFEPIGMTATTFIDRAPDDYEGFATPYIWRSDELPLEVVPTDMWQNQRVAGPSGSIATNAVDIAKWLQFLLNNATTQDGEQLLTLEAFKDYMEPNFPVGGIDNINLYSPVLNQPDEKYANGWYTGYYRGYALWSHSGYQFGYQALAHVLPGGDLGSFLMVNHEQYNPSHEILMYVDDVLLGEEPWFSADDVCASSLELKKSFDSDIFPGKFLSKDQKMNYIEEIQSTLKHPNLHTSDIHSEHLVESYVGQYGNFAYGNLTVVFNETTGGLNMFYGNLITFDLNQLVGDVFLPVGKPSPADLLPVGYLQFSSSQGDGVIDVVDWFFIQPLPQRFIRGLGIDEASPPNIDSC